MQVKWRKSSYSGDPTIGTCVELGHLGGSVRAVRDSTDPDGPRLTITTSDLRSLLTQLKS